LLRQIRQRAAWESFSTPLYSVVVSDAIYSLIYHPLTLTVVGISLPDSWWLV
jgi:hypothetical protein